MRKLHASWCVSKYATRDSYTKDESPKIDHGQVAEAFPKTEASFLNFPSRKLSFIGLGSPLKTVMYFLFLSLCLTVFNQKANAQLTGCDVKIVPDDRDMMDRVQLDLDDMCTACGEYGGNNGSPGMPPNGATGCAVIQIRSDFMPDCMTIMVDPQSTEKTDYYFDFNPMVDDCFTPDGTTVSQGETFTFWKQDLTLDNGFYHLLVCSQSTGNRFFRIFDGCCPDPGMDAEVFACEGSEDVIDLFAALGGADPDGTWMRESGMGGTFDDMAGTYIPGADGTTSTFSYTVPRDPNLPDCDLVSIVTVTIGGPDPGEGGETTVCLESDDPVDLSSLLTGGDPGGTWMRDSGMGGTFDAMAGTYTPGPDGTTSTFSYTVDPDPNFPDCDELSTQVTVNVDGPNPGIGRDTTVCYNIMDMNPVVVDLSTLLTGSDPGGTWMRESGMGGTFDMMEGTYAPAPDGTTSTFSYTVTDQMIPDCSFSTTVTVIIDDILQPDIVCDDLILALSYNDPEIIDADTLIESMSDVCGHIISVQGRRMEDPFACGYPDNAILSDSIAFCCADVGQTIMVELHVTDDSDNTAICMVEVTVVDEVAPQIWTCVDDVTISCSYPIDLDDLSEFGTLELDQADVDDLDIDDQYFQDTQFGDAREGMFQENCPGWTIRTVVADERECNQGDIIRKFYVTDASGNSDSCEQTITVIDIDPFIWDDITWPPDVDYEDCSLLLPNPGPGPDPDETGRPTYNITDICSQPTATYNDLIFDDPTSGCIKVQRTWKVIDWCTYDKVTKEGSWTWEQYIKIINTSPPIWAQVPDTLDRCVAGVGCASDQSFEISATDDCTAAEDLTYLFDVDLDNDGDIDTSGEANDITIYMEQGTHKITWTVEDRCGNDTIRMQIVNVKECKAPTPICYWGLAASLNQEGETVIWATDFNNKSSDNCTAEEDLIFSFSSDTDSTSMLITCDDIGELAVQMWVTDECGNQSYCETYILVQDSHGVCSGCECDQSEYTGMTVVTCNIDFRRSGTRNDPVAKIYDTRFNSNAPIGEDWAQTTLTEIPTANWTYNEIGPVFGIATKPDGTIFLAASDVYNKNALPNLNDKSSPYPPGQIFIAAPPTFMAIPFVELPVVDVPINGIGNIVYDLEYDQLFASNLEDGKIYRINNAGVIMETYDPFISDDGVDGIAPQEEQIWGIALNIENGTKKLYFPRITDSTREVYSIDITSGVFPASGTEFLELANLPGGLPRITDLAFSMNGDNLILAERGLHNADIFPIDDPLDRGPNYLTPHIAMTMSYTNDGTNWLFDKMYYVGGNWRIDGRNSAGGVDFGFVEKDGIINYQCDSLIWATGNALNSDTTDTSERVYGLQGIRFSGNKSSLELDGNMVTDYYIDFDATYNVSSSSTTVKGTIGDVEIIKCGIVPDLPINSATIAGHISTENNTPVREVQVNISGPELDTYQMTDGEGDYAFEALDAHYNYEVIPVKDDNPLEGVSTLDIVLVQQHILGIKELESPYKLIAADINNSESVSSIDLIQLRKMILGIHDAFPENNSWRFVESQYGILEEASPWPFVEGMYVEDLSEDMMGNDFVAVKIGDVNGSVEEKLTREQVETRSSEHWVLGAGDQNVKAGEVVEMTLTGQGLRQMIALQWTITIDSDKMSVVGWDSGLMSVSDAHFGVIEGEGQHLTFAWTDLESKSFKDDSELMTITFQARAEGKLSEMIEFGSTITPAVGYNTAQDKVDLQWQWQGDVSGEVVLYQNAPNPFLERTNISFDLPYDMNATLELYDVSGRLMYRKNDFYNQGKNTIFVNSSEIKGMPGVVYYVLKTEGNSITKKMILLR